MNTRTFFDELTKWKEKQVADLLSPEQLNVGQMSLTTRIMVLHHPLKKSEVFVGNGIGFLLLQKLTDEKDPRIIHLHVLTPTNDGWFLVINTAKLFLPRFPNQP